MLTAHWPVQRVGADTRDILGADLVRALGNLNVADFAQISRALLREDLPTACRQAVRPIAGSFQALQWTCSSVRDRGFKATGVELVGYSKSALRDAKRLPGRIKSGVIGSLDTVLDDLAQLETRHERGVYLLKLIVYLGSAAGAVYAGYVTGDSLPDRDWALGGAGHRNFITHSALPAVAFGLCCRFVYRLIAAAEKNLPSDSKDRSLVAFLQGNLGLFAFGGAIGVASHLFQDAFIDGPQTVKGFPDTSLDFGTIIHGSYVDDKAYLAIQSLLSAFCLGPVDTRSYKTVGV